MSVCCNNQTRKINKLLVICRNFGLVAEVNITTTEFLGIVFRATTKEFLELIGTVKLFQNLGCHFRLIFHKIRKIILLL